MILPEVMGAEEDAGAPVEKPIRPTPTSVGESATICSSAWDALAKGPDKEISEDKINDGIESQALKDEATTETMGLLPPEPSALGRHLSCPASTSAWGWM